ncbi:MAG: sodium:proton antiporter [Polyangiaceae bacterium]|nr:sodium:proton antiporter [Polyangiaceae bacterium]
MSRIGRQQLFGAAAVVMAALFFLAFTGLPGAGAGESDYGALVTAAAGPERHLTNAVTAVTFDYRGVDTMGEELVLFAGLVGATLLLRPAGRERRRRAPEHARRRRARAPSDAARLLGRALIPLTVLIGAYVVAHGPLTPGGGFQGGALAGTAPLLVYLVSGYRAFRGVVSEELVELVEGSAAAAYAVIGLLGAAAGAAFLENVAPLGPARALAGSGTIAALNLSVGFGVAAAFVLLSLEFLAQTHEVRRVGRRP